MVLSFGPFEHRSLEQRQLKNHNVVSATSQHALKLFQIEIVQCEKVKLQFPKTIGDSGLCCVWEGLAFFLVDLTFHGQWHVFRVRRQSPCRDSLACVWSHPGLATCKGSPVEVVKAKCHNCSSKLCLSFGPFEPRSLQQRWLCKNYMSGTACVWEALLF